MQDTSFLANPQLRIKILLIEDNPGDARIVRELFNESAPGHFELVHASLLSEGAEQLGRDKFEAVLLDLSLPDSQGLETFDRVRKLAPKLPVIVLTGLNDETMALKAIKSGAQDYLPKNQLTGFLLARTVRYAIERERLFHQLAEALENVKTLSGLLPICGWCKKIRDDSGYWNKLETYITGHTTAQFSHGLCPTCAVKQFEESGFAVPEHIRKAAEQEKGK